MSEETKTEETLPIQAEPVDFSKLVTEFAETNVAFAKELTKGNDKAMVRAIDQLGSSMIIKGAEMMLQAGAPVELVIQRVAGVVKLWRTEELKGEMQSEAKNKKLIIGS
jgi:hypothetical protein